MPEFIIRLYSAGGREKAFAAKRSATDLVHHVKDAFDEALSSPPLIHWMDAKTRNKGREKGLKMDHLIGVLDDDELKEVYSDRRGLWGCLFQTKKDESNKFDRSKPFESNARYHRKWNNMEVLSPYMVPPHFFSDEGEEVTAHHELFMTLNFGTMGRVIGHEITHGFDEEGMRKVL